MDHPDPSVSGLYGKLPGLGDFLTRRLPAHFVTPWDQWLRESIAASQHQLGDAWLDNYLTSPLWRFALSAGIAGQTGWIGVLMPSVDRVGRYFPFTVACALPIDCEPTRAFLDPDWFDRAEQIALDALEQGLDPNSVDERVLALGRPSYRSPATGRVPALPGAGVSTDTAWHAPCPSPGSFLETYAVLLGHALGELHFAYSLWWSAGSDRVEPSFLTCQGLPKPDGFVALLSGEWSGCGWLQLGPSK